MTRTDQTLSQRIEKLRYDRTSGAMDLAIDALVLASDWVTAGKAPAKLAAELGAMHPAIAPVANVARLLGQRTSDLPQHLKDMKDSLVNGNRLIAENLRRLIPKNSTVITLSNSTTVRDALLKLEVRSVYVLESQPGGEGKQLAEALLGALKPTSSAAARYEVVHLVPDSAIGNIVPKVDCALVGTDAIDPTGAILHKVGTFPLALCCQRFSKPFYAAGHSFKAMDQLFEGLPEPDQELESQLFDCTPADLITELVTEKAPLLIEQ